MPQTGKSSTGTLTVRTERPHMITEESLLEVMEDYQENLPAAEAAYLVATDMKIEEVNENLRHRYGSGQGYADFKRDLESLNDIKVTEQINKLAVNTGERTDTLDDIPAEDVDMSVASVIRNAFTEHVQPRLREGFEEQLAELSDEAQLLGGIARKGYDLNLWDTEPTEANLWRPFTLMTGRIYSEQDQTAYFTELVEAGCIYQRDRGNLRLTPTFIQFDDPFANLRDPAEITGGDRDDGI